jgi:hypothetical protein
MGRSFIWQLAEAMRRPTRRGDRVEVGDGSRENFFSFAPERKFLRGFSVWVIWRGARRVPARAPEAATGSIVAFPEEKKRL